MHQVKLLQINSADNVAVALADIPAGETAKVGDVELLVHEAVGRGHKIALADIAVNENIIKYGNPIGHASQAIKVGSTVHVHNLKTNLSGTEGYRYEPQLTELEAATEERYFDAYLRRDGNVGIRNELWIIPTVGCVNKTTEILAHRYAKELKAENVDGVFAFPHPYGCSQLGDDHLNTQKILAGLARHPNAGGVLIVGLGCENNTLESFRAILGEVDEHRVKFMIVQEMADEIEVGLEQLRQLERYAAGFKRQPVPLAKLRVGLKCGASDGFSGITANPLVGELSDMLIAQGGTSVLSEVPEMFGAERLFMARCADKHIFDKCVNMVNGFKEYFQRHNQVVYENPSPGNKQGGISTLEEKSLGCTQKGGSSTVVDVLEYGETITLNGLNLLTGPGNDMVAITVLAAAGAHIILFTTGRGTPLGGPVPTMKISTNSELAKFKSNWIDFNAGTLVEDETMAEVAPRLLEAVVATAEGQKTKSEQNGYREIALFKDGVTL